MHVIQVHKAEAIVFSTRFRFAIFKTYLLLFFYSFCSRQTLWSEPTILRQYFCFLVRYYRSFSIWSEAAIYLTIINAVPLQEHLQVFDLLARISFFEISLRRQCRERPTIDSSVLLLLNHPDNVCVIPEKLRIIVPSSFLGSGISDIQFAILQVRDSKIMTARCPEVILSTVSLSNNEKNRPPVALKLFICSIAFFQDEPPVCSGV